MLSLPTLRAELRKHLGQDEDDLPDDDADLLLNRTYWEILEKFHVRETESSTTFTTVASQREYELPPSFESLRVSSFVDPDSGQHTKLDRISIKEYENIYSDDTDEEGPPTKYFRGNSAIVLWPTPDDVYSIVIHYNTQLDDLSDDNVDPALPKSWQEMVLMGAVWRGFLQVNDYVKAKMASATYSQMVSTAVPVESKEEWDSSTAGVSVRGREY